MDPKMQICIAGGGNLAHASIACIGYHNPNYDINLYVRTPEKWADQITGITEKSAWEFKGNMVGKINKKSNDAKDVVPGSNVIIVCGPAHVKPDILKQIKPYINEGTMIGTIFGQGGFDMMATSILGEDIQAKNLTLFSLQYVPFICKAKTYGSEVWFIGPKKHLYACAYPIEKTDRVANTLSLMYYIPCKPIPNFLNLTLCPSNQIIHPGRVVGFFKKWDGKKGYDPKKMPKLYSGLD